MYEHYCQNKPHSESLWNQCSDSAFFQECQRKLEHKLSLDSYLLKPIQRLAKYQLILKELLKHCDEPRYRAQLQEALDCMLDLLKSVNDSMHQIAIVGYQGELGPLGRVLLQGGFSVWSSHKRAPAARMREMARFKGARRHVFLYERALVCCKRRDDRGRSPVYSFKSCLGMSSVSLAENVKGDAKKFELCHRETQEVYVLQAPSVEVKAAWLAEIQKIIGRPRQGDAARVQTPSNATPARTPLTSWASNPHLPASRFHLSFAAAAPSSDIGDGPEDWGAADASNVSDSDDAGEGERPASLVGGGDAGPPVRYLCRPANPPLSFQEAGRYRILAAGCSASGDGIAFARGDVIRPLRRDDDGKWSVACYARSGRGARVQTRSPRAARPARLPSIARYKRSGR
uniref:MCF.2 cell line derived transforming sequence b n=1 Tax=Hippocampus comes TaxID=109280 RepID=A0A3Q2Z7B2_HIPCM